MADNNDGKVVFQLDVDDKTVKKKLNKSMREIDRELTNGKQPTITVNAKTGPAVKNLESVQTKAENLGKTTRTVTVNAKTAAASGQLDDVETKAEGIEKSDPTVTVDADTSGADAELDKLEGRLEKLKSGVVMGVGQSIGSGVMGMASGIAGKAIGSIGSIFSGGMTYETALAKVSTMTPEGADMGAFSDKLLDLSVATGEDINVLAEAAYNMLSAGIDFGDASGSNLIKYLANSQMLALGGFSDTNSAGLAVAKTLNAYGMDQSQQGRIANVMLKTQNKGITDVDKLSQNMSGVTSIAAAGGVSIEEVGAMLATITAQGVETSEATTQASSLIEELLSPDSKGYEAMQRAMRGTDYAGMSLPEILANGGNMGMIMTAMNDYAGKSGKEFIEFFGSGVAYEAALKLITNNGEMYMENLEYMMDGTDAVTAANEKMAGTNATMLSRIGALIEKFKLNLYAALSPALLKALEVLTGEKFTGVINKFSDSIVDFLSGDTFFRMIDGFIAVLEWVVGVLAGDIDLGDEVAKWFKAGMKIAGEWLMDALRAFAETIVNGIIDTINGFLEVLNGALGWLGINFKPIEHVDYTPSESKGAGRYTDKVEELGDESEETGRWINYAGDTIKSFTGRVNSGTAAVSSFVHYLTSRYGSGSSGGATAAGGVGGGTAQIRGAYLPTMSGRDRMDYAAMANAMSGLKVVMDGRTVGRLVEPSVSAAQSIKLHRAERT